MPTELGILTADPSSIFASAFAINSSGAAVGQSTLTLNGKTSTKAVRWDAYGMTATMLDNLGTPAGSNSNAIALSINDAGTAVGYATKFGPTRSSLGTRAIRWDASGRTASELGALSTSASGITASYAFAINNSGVVIGNE